MRVAARQVATAGCSTPRSGECDLTPWFAAVGDGPGLLILDGLIAFDTRVGDRTATELIGAGDLLQPPAARADDMLERDRRLARAVPDPVRAARRRVRRARPRRGRRSRRRCCAGPAGAPPMLDVLRAISCQPRLEVRLVLLLWHLAARWGRVEPAGIRLTLPLTHRLLGQLVGAERPSISHALARLAARRAGHRDAPAICISTARSTTTSSA